MQHKLQSEVK
jgi:hypothetical protein